MQQRGVRQPIGERVVAAVGHGEQTAVGIEVQAAQFRPTGRRAGEIEREPFGHIAEVLQKVAGAVVDLEGAHHNVVGHEARVVDGADRVVARAVDPRRVVAHRRARRSRERRVEPTDRLGGLRIAEISIGILQRVDAVGALGVHPLDGKIAGGVGARHAVEGFVREGGVRCIEVQTDQNALHRFEVFGVEYAAGHLHGVGRRARGEDISVLPHRIAFVVVGDGVGEIDRVGRVGNHRVEEFDRDFAPRHFDFGLFDLRRRDNDFLRRVVYLDELVESEAELHFFAASHLFRRAHVHDVRWGLVVGTAVGAAALVGAARPKSQEAEENGEEEGKFFQSGRVFG